VTTILADAAQGIMVCDSKCSGGDLWFPMTKVHRVHDELVGIIGTVSQGQLWLEWYRGGRKGAKPKLTGFGALILRPSGLYEVDVECSEQVIERGHHGAGTGGGFALAAFMAGADHKRAVEIACQIDNNSGGDVIVHSLKS
jgi:hypothetical protein